MYMNKSTVADNVDRFSNFKHTSADIVYQKQLALYLMTFSNYRQKM